MDSIDQMISWIEFDAKFLQSQNRTLSQRLIDEGDNLLVAKKYKKALKYYEAAIKFDSSYS